MQTKISLLLFVVFLFSGCKEEIQPSIKLKVEFSDKLKKELPRIYFIDIYKNGKIFKKYQRFEKPRIAKEILIDSLSNGEYEFIYQNFLNQTLKKNIEVKENKVYNISIFPDYSNYKEWINKSFVRNLKENEKVEFSFESLGCFHSLESVLIVSRKENSYYAESHGLSKKLNEKELDAIIKMECELNLLQGGGCTTKDHYVVKFGKQEKEFNDRSCAWEGWKNMIEAINLKNNEIKTPNQKS